MAPVARARYADEWGLVQAKFVDDPATAVLDANGLVLRVMGDRVASRTVARASATKPPARPSRQRVATLPSQLSYMPA